MFNPPRTDEERNVWLHTHILRQPRFCQGEMRHYMSPLSEDLLRGIHSFRCLQCGGVLRVSEENLRDHSSPSAAIKAIFPHGHRIFIPEYSQGAQLLPQILTHIGRQDQQDGLLHQLLLLLGVAKADLPLSPDALKLAFQMELLASSNVAIIDRIYQAYQDMQDADWQEHVLIEAINARYIRGHLSRMWDKGAVPLFARIGGPKEVYHSWDLPYALVYPSRYCCDQVEIIHSPRERDSWMFPPQEVTAFGSRLRERDEFRTVSDPRHFDVMHYHLYWSFHAQW